VLHGPTLQHVPCRGVEQLLGLLRCPDTAVRRVGVTRTALRVRAADCAIAESAGHERTDLVLGTGVRFGVFSAFAGSDALVARAGTGLAVRRAKRYGNEPMPRRTR
jgi:hypothetical protein